MKMNLWFAFGWRLLAGIAVLALIDFRVQEAGLRAGVLLATLLLLVWWCARFITRSVLPQLIGLARLEQEQMQTAERCRELETILDSMADAVLAVDSSAHVQWTNTAMRRILYGPYGQTRERTSPALMHDVCSPEILACLETSLVKRDECEVRAMAVLQGHVFEVRTAPMPNGGAVAVLHDVTQLEQLERMKRDLVANVSHELRTPLTSITGYVETLLEEAPESGLTAGMGYEFLTIILKNARRMNSLVEDLLVLARVESGRHALRPRPVQASTLVRETLEAIAGSLRETSAHVQLGETIEALVYADVDAVVRVLTNLIENGLKYGCEPAGGRVLVSVYEDGETPGMARFEVCDFGTGIAPEHLPRLFERFYRVDKARSRESGGTGLGLAIARRLTEAQGGSIWCTSELHHGSTFSFTLPLAASTSVDEQDVLEVYAMS